MQQASSLLTINQSHVKSLPFHDSHMQSHLRRFRINREIHSSPRHAAPGPASNRSKAKLSTCDRCRRLKRRCNKNSPECGACEFAGVTCSLSKIPNKVTLRDTQTDAEGIRSLGTRSRVNTEKGFSRSRPGGTRNAYGHRSLSSGLEKMIGSMDRHSGDDDLSRPVRTNVSSLTAKQDIRGQAESLERLTVDAYFRDAHRAYPFLEEREIIALLDAQSDPSLVATQSRINIDKLTLVMAIGASTLLRWGTNVGRYEKFLAIDYDVVVRNHETREDIEALQILFLLTVFSAFDPRRIATRPLIDATARLMLKLCLDKQCFKDGMSQGDAERNHRLFWSLYSLDRTEATSTGTPFVKDLMARRVPLPSITVEEFNSSEYLKHVSNLQVMRHLIQLRRLEEKVLVQAHLPPANRELSSSSDQCSHELEESLRTEIEDWYSGGCLLISTGSDDMALHIRISWLTARYYNLVILLYYPSRFNRLARFMSMDDHSSLARKYIHSISIAHEQRQLPLNQTTLFRLFPVLLVLMAWLNSNGFASSCEAQDTLTRLLFCSELLKSFPAHWGGAQNGATLLDQLCSTLIASPSQVSGKAPGKPILDRTSIQKLSLKLSNAAHVVLGEQTVYLPIVASEAPLEGVSAVLGT